MNKSLTMKGVEMLQKCSLLMFLDPCWSQSGKASVKWLPEHNQRFEIVAMYFYEDTCNDCQEHWVESQDVITE